MTPNPEAVGRPQFESVEAWRAEAVRLFGPDPMAWRFECPVCHHIASLKDWMDAGAPESAAAFSCLGRWTGADRQAFGGGKKKGPCNYAGGGLFKLNPVAITGVPHNVFAFACKEKNQCPTLE